MENQGSAAIDESGFLLDQFDFSTSEGQESYLNAVAFVVNDSGMENLSKADSMIAAEVLTRNFGYAQGANEAITGSDLESTKNQLLGTNGLAASLGKFVQTQTNNPDENSLRYAFFAEGKVTRGDRTIDFTFAEGSTKMANALGISDQEARAKINWSVYNNVINAAFDTPGLKSMEFSGGWRPTARDALTVLGKKDFDIARGKAGLNATWGRGHSLGMRWI